MSTSYSLSVVVVVRAPRPVHHHRDDDDDAAPFLRPKLVTICARARRAASSPAGVQSPSSTACWRACTQTDSTASQCTARVCVCEQLLRRRRSLLSVRVRVSAGVRVCVIYKICVSVVCVCSVCVQCVSVVCGFATKPRRRRQRRQRRRRA